MAVSLSRIREAAAQHAVVNIAAGVGGESATLVAAPGAGKVVVLLAFYLHATAAANLTWRSGTTAISGIIGTSATLPIRGEYNAAGHVVTAANETLALLKSTNAEIDGWITYCVVSTT